MLFDVVCACFKIEYFINTRAYDLHKKILVSSSILLKEDKIFLLTSLIFMILCNYDVRSTHTILALIINKNVKKKILVREKEVLVSKFTSVPIDTKSKQKLIHNANVSSVIINPYILKFRVIRRHKHTTLI